MPDRGDLGHCGRWNCEGPGDIELASRDGLIGYLCRDHAEELEFVLTNGRLHNAAKARDRFEELTGRR